MAPPPLRSERWGTALLELQGPQTINQDRAAKVPFEVTYDAHIVPCADTS